MMLQEVRAGATSSDLFRTAAQRLPPYEFHPLVQSAIGNGIGLSFEESPIFDQNEKSTFETGGVYTIRSGAMGKGSDNAIVSAMVAVSGTGIDVLWPAAEQTGNWETSLGSR
jgi:hypothetical protein